MPRLIFNECKIELLVKLVAVLNCRLDIVNVWFFINAPDRRIAKRGLVEIDAGTHVKSESIRECEDGIEVLATNVRWQVDLTFTSRGLTGLSGDSSCSTPIKGT